MAAKASSEIQQSTSSPVQQLEAAVKRPITIHTTLTASTVPKCHQQSQSPLFTLPAELREIIWSLATAPYYKPGTFLDESDRDYRPDHKAQRITSADLLATCRRIWLETNHMPMHQAHHCFYIPDPNRANDNDPTASMSSLKRFAAKLTLNHRPLLHNLHVFADLRHLESHEMYIKPALLSSSGVCPESLTITIRHVDWPPGTVATFSRWPLLLSRIVTNILRYQASPRIREVRLELEMQHPCYQSDLLHIIAFVRSQIPRVARADEFGGQLCMELQPAETVAERTWTGGSRGQGEPERQGVRVQSVATLVWKVRRVATLVWKVRRDEGEAEGGEVPAVPIFVVSDAEREALFKPGSEDDEARKQIEERWEREGSLLKYVG